MFTIVTIWHNIHAIYIHIPPAAIFYVSDISAANLMQAPRRNSVETPPTLRRHPTPPPPQARRWLACGGGSLSLHSLPLSVFFYLFRDTLQTGMTIWQNINFFIFTSVILSCVKLSPAFVTLSVCYIIFFVYFCKNF